MKITTTLFTALALAAIPSRAADFLHRLPLAENRGVITLPANAQLTYLHFGSHAYEPDQVVNASPASSPAGALEPIGAPARVLIAPFQQLYAVRWRFDPSLAGASLSLKRPSRRDAFWDQIIVVDEPRLGRLPHFHVTESGKFSESLPAHVRSINFSTTEIRRQQESLFDPVIPAEVDHEIAWRDLEAAALPLDFQKVLLSSPNDPSPAFAFQNGQWLTTWLSRDLPRWTKEDHWFAPALLIGDSLVRPAPLSARTAFLKANAEGSHTLPAWQLEWSYHGTTVRQELFSHRANGTMDPALFVRFQVENAPPGTRLALGLGRRPNAHTWDDPKRERTPVPFFTLSPNYTRKGTSVIDAWDKVILASVQPFTLEPLGPVEMLLVFEADAEGRVLLQTPQTEIPLVEPELAASVVDRAYSEFISFWSAHLSRGAQVKLPSVAWTERIDTWIAQVEAITRVHYQGKERLSYGAYFYQAYFGIEEAWPPVTLALWGRVDEAKRQVEIMLDRENLDKSNIHHQSRNGAAPAAAAAVARLSQDREWLASVAPTLIECAQWTDRVRSENIGNRSELTRGLLPPHIYGGDVRDPATSLFATVACWRGMTSTADAFLVLGNPSLADVGRRLKVEAARLHARISEVMHAVSDRSATPPFLPFALELPSLAGKNEGPHSRLTETRFGNYWNLFAPSFLELDFRLRENPKTPNDWVFDYVQTHGGLWAGLPRFYQGLDAAYAIGNIAYLMDRAVRDIRFRPQALSSLQSFMLHAASRNGHTIPEVAGLFPYRMIRESYEQLVRESPWSFGMYDATRYLEGHISFTEPLGSGAGEALWLIRHALMAEMRDIHGIPDGGLMLLPAVPAEWLDEGNEIVLTGFPTYYGTLSATVRSAITSRREIEVECRFKPFVLNRDAAPRAHRFHVRLAPKGERAQEMAFEPGDGETVRLVARW